MLIFQYLIIFPPINPFNLSPISTQNSLKFLICLPSFLKFTNDTPNWLLMETYMGDSWLQWKFYATSDGRSVDWDSSGLKNKQDPPVPVYQENPDLAKGEIKQVDWAVEGAARDIILHARRPGWDLDISGARVHMSSGGGGPGVFDMDTSLYRPGTAKDLYDVARIVDAMEHIHHFSRSIVARDATDNLQLDVNTAFALLRRVALAACVGVVIAHFFLWLCAP